MGLDNNIFNDSVGIKDSFSKEVKKNIEEDIDLPIYEKVMGDLTGLDIFKVECDNHTHKEVDNKDYFNNGDISIDELINKNIHKLLDNPYIPLEIKEYSIKLGTLIKLNDNYNIDLFNVEGDTITYKPKGRMNVGTKGFK